MELENTVTQDEENNFNEVDVDIGDYMDRNDRSLTEMENFDEGSSEMEDVVETKDSWKKKKTEKTGRKK